VQSRNAPINVSISAADIVGLDETASGNARVGDAAVGDATGASAGDTTVCETAAGLAAMGDATEFAGLATTDDATELATFVGSAIGAVIVATAAVGDSIVESAFFDSIFTASVVFFGAMAE
jgi:hypothetical protein